MKKLIHLLVTVRRTILFFFLWPLMFRIGSIKPIDEKLILFAYNRNYKTIPDNMRGLYEYLSAKGYDCRKMLSPAQPLISFIFDLKFQLSYARCKCVFVTDNFDPLYAHKPNRGTRVIQLWHACGAFKKWGYSTLDLAWGGDRRDMTRFPMHNTYTDVFVSAESVIPCYAEAFGCDRSIIRAFGTPRTDVFFDSGFVASGREKLLSLFPEIGGRKIILYAPTFRGNSPDDAYNDRALDIGLLRERLGSEYALVLKLHPFTAAKYGMTDEEKRLYGDFAFDASGKLGADEAICAADILIADYSSIIFEYSLLEKPMLFFAYDLEEYERDRSFYYDYKSFIPGRLVLTTEETADAIENGDFKLNRVKPFKKVFMDACDGGCVKRIADYAVE